MCLQISTKVALKNIQLYVSSFSFFLDSRRKVEYSMRTYQRLKLKPEN